MFFEVYFLLWGWRGVRVCVCVFKNSLALLRWLCSSWSHEREVPTHVPKVGRLKLPLLSKQKFFIPKQEDGLAAKARAFFHFSVFITSSTVEMSFMSPLTCIHWWVEWFQNRLNRLVFFKEPLHKTIGVYVLDNMIVLKAYSQHNFPKQLRIEILFYTTTRTPSLYVESNQSESRRIRTTEQLQ